MRKLSTFEKTSFPTELVKLLPRPSNVITVGAENCDYTSLVTALQEGAEGDSFIVYGGTHDGKLILRHNQSIHCIGNVILKQSANDYLFQFVCPSIYDPVLDTPYFKAYFSGALPYFSPYAYNRWLQPSYSNAPFDNFSGLVALPGLYLERTFVISQSSTNLPTINDTLGDNTPVCNFDVTKISPSPVRERSEAGIYNIQIAPDVPVASALYHLEYRHTVTPNRYLVWLKQSDNFIFDIQVTDLAFTNVDTWSLDVHYKIPCYFSFL